MIGRFTVMDLPTDDFATIDVHDHIKIEKQAFDSSGQIRVSNLRESHPQILSEPDVNLSARLAPIVPVDVTKPAFQWGNNRG